MFIIFIIFSFLALSIYAFKPRASEAVILGILYVSFMMGALLMVGCAPQQGPKGEPGTSIVGPPGSDGKPGTEVTIVKLCPGFTQYAGTYVEIAFCISNKLYGVYSANNGFLVEIVPGVYQSQGINSTCTLTVKPNCEVSW